MDDEPFAGNDGAVFHIDDKPHREQTPPLIALWGFSDSGKTYSALRLARGLVGETGKIVLADTENKRAKYYAGKFGGWSHLDMQPPFTPERYVMALDAAIRAQADIVIFDSASHVWEGEGGIIDQADQVKTEGLHKWNKPKMAHKRMMNRLMRAPIPIIFCIRAKDKNVQVGKGKEAQIVNVGHVPICEKNFPFEMTFNVHMESGTRKPLDPIKAPEEIAHAIKPGEFITEDMGKVIAEWLAGGAPVDHAVLVAQATARDVATLGKEQFGRHWKTLSQAERKALKPILKELETLAKEADDAADDEPEEAGEPFADNFTKTAA